MEETKTKLYLFFLCKKIGFNLKNQMYARIWKGDKFMTVDQMQILALKPLLTVEETAAFTGIGERTLRSMIAAPNCDFTLHIGKKVLIKKTIFLQYLDNINVIF